MSYARRFPARLRFAAVSSELCPVTARSCYICSRRWTAVPHWPHLNMHGAVRLHTQQLHALPLPGHVLPRRRSQTQSLGNGLERRYIQPRPLRRSPRALDDCPLDKDLWSRDGMREKGRQQSWMELSVRGKYFYEVRSVARERHEHVYVSGAPLPRAPAPVCLNIFLEPKALSFNRRNPLCANILNYAQSPVIRSSS